MAGDDVRTLKLLPLSLGRGPPKYFKCKTRVRPGPSMGAQGENAKVLLIGVTYTVSVSETAHYQYYGEIMVFSNILTPSRYSLNRM